jgi:hypothetical protein
MRHRKNVNFEPLERRTLMSLSPLGGEFRVNTTTSTNETNPAMAMDVDGDFVVVWTSYVEEPADGGGPEFIGDVYAQRFNALGVKQGPEFRVNTTTANNQRLPAVAMDDAGNFVVAWTSEAQDGSGDGIYIRRYNAAGTPLTGEIRVNTFTTANQVSPAIAMDPNGDSVVVWTSYGQESAEPGVYAQRYNAAGTPQGGEMHVNTFTTSYQRFGSVGMDDAGNFVIAWEGFDQDGSGIGSYAQRYNAAGVPQGSEFRINTETFHNQHEPSVAVDPSGDFVIAWSSDTQDGDSNGVYARRYNASGVPQGGEFRVNIFTTHSQRAPSAAIDPNGNFVITWGSGTQDGSSYGVYARSYSAAGVPDGAEFRVNTFTTEIQHVPAVALDAEGDAVITWTSSNQDGFSGGIYAQRYDASAAPAVNASSFLFETKPHRLRFGFSQNVSSSLSTSDLVLQNLTSGQTIPAGQLTVSYDAVTDTATFSYTGNASGIIGVLPDGNYRATLLAAGITNATGTPMGANHVFDFFFLNGDADRDGRVNLNDFTILAGNFGQVPRTFSQGDFNYNSIVNLDDFTILAGKFGTAVGPETTSMQPGQFAEAPISESEPDALAALLM